MVKLDIKAQHALKIIISYYDGNTNLAVRGMFDVFPDNIKDEIMYIFKSLMNSGLIFEFNLELLNWSVVLTNLGLSYFKHANFPDVSIPSMFPNLPSHLKELYHKIIFSNSPLLMLQKLFDSSSQSEQKSLINNLEVLLSYNLIKKDLLNINHTNKLPRLNIRLNENKTKSSTEANLDVKLKSKSNFKLNSDILKKYGLFSSSNRTFQEMNLLIGENGAGKSRFLKAVRDSILLDEKIQVIYMDFAAIQPNPTVVPVEEHFLTNSDDNNKLNSALEQPDSPQLIDSIIYRDRLPQKVYSDFVPFLEKDCSALFLYLSESWQDKKSLKTMRSRLAAINDYLHIFLKRTIIINADGCAISSRENPSSFDDLNHAIVTMSPGERVILYFALGILAISTHNQKYVLLIDEPETHLHPCALIGIVQSIHDDLNPECTFIASHSIFLIPQFKFEETIFLENSKIEKACSKMYQDIYQHLVGSEDDENHTLYQFLTSIYDWQYAGFLAECFFKPESVSNASRNDSQYKKLRDALNVFDNIFDKKINILDYGAGSGRIAKCLELDYKFNSYDNLFSKITYNIYDKYEISDDLPVAEWMGEKYTSLKNMFKVKGNFDVIILYNVLHEIGVNEWMHDINQLINSLSPNGAIVFGERIVLSKGEKPYGKSGYLILGKQELCCIFGDNFVEEIVLSDTSRDPTSCFVISPHQTTITTGKVKASIRMLIENTYAKIKDCNETKSGGRSYAFYCQQYINAIQALEILESKP